MRRVIVILLALMLTGQTWAAIDTWQFKDEAQEQAFREITSQLRCLNARTTASPTQTR